MQTQWSHGVVAVVRGGPPGVGGSAVGLGLELVEARLVPGRGRDGVWYFQSLRFRPLEQFLAETGSHLHFFREKYFEKIF